MVSKIGYASIKNLKTMSLIIFSHGKESGPNGNKIRILTEVAHQYGFETLSVDYTSCKNASERVVLLRRIISENKAKSKVLVGSSMGGYVATVLASEVAVSGLFLLCPALYMPASEYEAQTYAPKCDTIEIIHGWDDDVVPFKNSITFGRKTKAILHLVNDNHPLKQSYDFMKTCFEGFLKRIEDN